MIYLVDTNVLLRFLRLDDPNNSIVKEAVNRLEERGNELRTTSQNFMEFWNVSTRPIENNGFGYTTSETDQFLQTLELLFPLLQDSPDIYPEWRKLVVVYKVSGIQVFDARLVASMISHNIKHILTFNTTDFTRYAPEGITTVNPKTVLQ